MRSLDGVLALDKPEGPTSHDMVALARCSALVTEASLLSSMSATSDDRNPSTSLSTSTARCRGGRCCTAVTKASAIASLASYRASGPALASGSPSSSTSG